MFVALIDPTLAVRPAPGADAATVAEPGAETAFTDVLAGLVGAAQPTDPPAVDMVAAEPAAQTPLPTVEVPAPLAPRADTDTPPPLPPLQPASPARAIGSAPVGAEDLTLAAPPAPAARQRPTAPGADGLMTARPGAIALAVGGRIPEPSLPGVSAPGPLPRPETATPPLPANGADPDTAIRPAGPVATDLSSAPLRQLETPKDMTLTAAPAPLPEGSDEPADTPRPRLPPPPEPALPRDAAPTLPTPANADAAEAPASPLPAKANAAPPVTDRPAISSPAPAATRDIPSPDRPGTLATVLGENSPAADRLRSAAPSTPIDRPAPAPETFLQPSATSVPPADPGLRAVQDAIQRPRPRPVSEQVLSPAPVPPRDSAAVARPDTPRTIPTQPPADRAIAPMRAPDAPVSAMTGQDTAPVPSATPAAPNAQPATPAPAAATPPPVPIPAPQAAPRPVRDAPGVAEATVPRDAPQQPVRASPPDPRPTGNPPQTADPALPKTGETLTALPQPIADDIAPLATFDSPDQRISSGPPTGGAVPYPPTTDAPRGPALQIAETLRLGPGTYDVTLHPEELGKLTVSVAADDGKLTVMVAADRPDTLDHLRRNADILTAEAARGGFTDLDFSFSDHRQAPRDDKGPHPSPDRATSGSPGPAWSSPPPRVPTAAGGLDLRL